MRPSVRSRLWAAATAFVLGFVMANVGILLVAGRDRWVWLVAAVTLMVTGAVGVLIADTRRRISLWAVICLELLVLAVGVPVLWTLTVAITPADSEARSLLPDVSSWSAFGDVLAAGQLREAALTTIVSASAATLVAMALAVPAAYALVRGRVAGRGVVYLAFAATLLLPALVVAVPWFETYARWGVLGQRWAPAPLLLVVALPLAVWLCVTIMRGAPWSLRDSIRTDGASRRQVLRAFAVPALGARVLVAAAVVWVVTAQDVVIGAALGVTADSRPLPATLLLLEGDRAQVAAAGLLWLLPALALAVLAPRHLARLIGRDYR